jgi:hypothetical protein
MDSAICQLSTTTLPDFAAINGQHNGQYQIELEPP